MVDSPFYSRPFPLMPSRIKPTYQLATERYAELGVDTKAALRVLETIPVSLHCWQGDDVGGFENSGGALGGGLAVTGNYPGKARTPDELRADLDKALSLIPGNTSAEPARILRRVRRQKSGSQRESSPRISRTGSLGRRRNGLGLDFNPDLLRPPEGRGWLHALPSRTRACAISGSSTAAARARSARRWARRSAPRA